MTGIIWDSSIQKGVTVSDPAFPVIEFYWSELF
jgi:hypothetical protein